ncbi:MAG: type II toxin-antitoxin system VapC family toxin [Coraliomargarita sp.]|nr:type II toxin-antitoxin system VapC family toxin [Coraliomargarita sp.]
MSAWLIDTNIVSEIMRRKPDPSVEQWCLKEGAFHISVITIDEITFGLTKKSLDTKVKWFEDFLSNRCDILPATASIAHRAGQIRGQLATKGKPRSQADMLIAATAWAHDLTLATRNTRDFERTGIALFNPFDAS